MTKLAFIGLGVMGSPMAVPLQQAGYQVSGYNKRRDTAGPLVAAGGRRAASIAEAVVFLEAYGVDLEAALTVLGGGLAGSAVLEQKTGERTTMNSPRSARYYAPTGGLPGQGQLTTDRAVFTEAYAVLPRGTMRDIVTSRLPFWERTRLWVIARPLSGFAETFSQYIVEVSAGGGSDRPEPDPDAEAVLFVAEGTVRLTVAGQAHALAPGGYAYLPPGEPWTLRNPGDGPARFHWIRKAYQRVEGIEPPAAFVTSERDIEPAAMPDTDGAWATTRFVDPDDVRHDMHVNIVTFQPGGAIPFPETHVMEHGLYVLEGKAVYLLNRDWIEVEAGDFMWLRAFCPQACYAGGPGPFRYLLYKDVNRHAPLARPLR